MILESLLELVETLKKRIDDHGDQLRQSEALTRYALIDPLLRELGWDTEDPNMVRPEYRVSNNQIADYVLLVNHKPSIVVESKRLDESLQGGKALDQGILYCAYTGSKYFLLTDGRRWELYESGRTISIISFDLNVSAPAEVCLKALALWRPSVESGSVTPGHESVFGSTEESPVSQAPPSTVSPSPPVDEHDWQQLTQVSATKGQTPVELLFPDGYRTQLKNWGAAPVEVVRWLTDQKLLSASDCPIMYSNPRTFRYMVHVQPFHSNGAPFTSQTEVNGLFVERHDNRSALIDKTKAILQLVGQDPAQFSIRFS